MIPTSSSLLALKVFIQIIASRNCETRQQPPSSLKTPSNNHGRKIETYKTVKSNASSRATNKSSNQTSINSKKITSTWNITLCIIRSHTILKSNAWAKFGSSIWIIQPNPIMFSALNTLLTKVDIKSVINKYFIKSISKIWLENLN